jgi:hypothetical protein
VCEEIKEDPPVRDIMAAHAATTSLESYRWFLALFPLWQPWPMIPCVQPTSMDQTRIAADQCAAA